MTTPDTAAMRARLQAATWQPIETAPKDGTRVLLSAPYQWAPDKRWIAVGSYAFRGERWEDDADGPFNTPPTHWMPLPTAPGDEAPSAALLAAYDEQAAAEVERLRAALIRACNATGGYCGTDSVGASNGFLTLVGAEVEACIGKLRAQIAALTAAAEGARAGAIEEAAAAVERAAVALDQRKCCGVGVYSAHGGPPECCSDPLYMLSSQEAATAIRALAAPATGDANG